MLCVPFYSEPGVGDDSSSLEISESKGQRDIADKRYLFKAELNSLYFAPHKVRVHEV